jgi:DUF1680 family protein
VKEGKALSDSNVTIDASYPLWPAPFSMVMPIWSQGEHLSPQRFRRSRGGEHTHIMEGHKPMMSLAAVDFTRVRLQDRFWAPRLETNRKVTLPIQYKHLRKTGRIDGIDPDHRPGDRTAHHIFWDSDVAKWMETAAYSLATHPDPELEAQLDEVIAKFAKLQTSEGYINSWFTAVEPEKRWTNLRDWHELYCAGHLMEAAVAHFRATGKRGFLDMMCRYADCIDSVFGTEEGKLRGYPGHEEIELALVKLYDVTGESRYLELAKYFVDQRGQQPHYYDEEARKRGDDPSKWTTERYRYNQSHLPVREQSEVAGHAVRAMYLYCGMADVARETADQSLVTACNTLWDDVCLKHLYITGGIGQSNRNEGFTFHYDLPEETAYCETCAAIGLVFWNHRLLQLHGEARFADCMERGLYNGTISGWSLSGDRFLYVNPLASTGNHHRQEWFGCACCPGNISRMLASVGQFVYSERDDSAWVHLYAEGEGRLQVGGRQVTITQQTDYPWDGTVKLELGLAGPLSFTLAMRIPGWCREVTIMLNGNPVDITFIVEKGYAKLTREWRDGDTIELCMAMPVERVRANPAVRQANGKVALQRGPVVYCLEEVDNPVAPLNRIALPRDSVLEARYDADLLGGVIVITGEAEAIKADSSQTWLYGTDVPQTESVQITAVPYAVWDNREPGQMLVWLREA